MGPFLVALIPTVLLLALAGAYRLSQPLTRARWVAFLLGMVVCLPVWVLESSIETPAESLDNLYERAWIQQILGAALIEEVALLAVLFAVVVVFRHSVVRTPKDVVIVAVCGAIGFTTVENLLAVRANPEMSVAVSRLLSLFAGHATLQLGMGYFAGQALYRPQGRLWNLLAMLAVPVAVHGYGDFSEAMFTAFQTQDPTSLAAQNWFTAWIFGLFAYLVLGLIVLWQLRRSAEQPSA